jgi:2-polyprenyl-6-methoxyphenol hydroxylase-like FAD-dependent oxidoreductase
VTEVLIVGAGPSGLVLALWLRRAGIGVRIIDKTSEPGTTSRALVVHARTLELYRQLGLADEVVSRALPFSAVNLWARGRHVAHAELGAIGRGLTPFPEMMIFPQDEHERLLLEHLRRAGVEVERRTELTGLEPLGDRVVVTTRGPADKTDELKSEVAFVAGCDGAHSTVRHRLGVDFPGGTYERVFYVADVELRGLGDEASLATTRALHLALDDADFLAIFPWPASEEPASSAP